MVEKNTKMEKRSKNHRSSRLGRNFQEAKEIFKCRVSKNHPFVLFHYITTRCKSRCPYCYYSSGILNDLKTVELLALYEQAKEMGYLATIITGGEPLTREDLPVILEYIKGLDLKIYLITNGYLLEKKWQSIKDYVDTLIISSDLADDDLDKIRYSKDSFQAIVNSLDLVKTTSSVPVVINSIIWQKNKHGIGDLAMFARDMGVKINFYPMDAVRQFYDKKTENRNHLALDYADLSEVFRLIAQLKKENYPIINSEEYINFFIDYKPQFTCHFQKIFTQIMANGDVINCSAQGHALGNIRASTFGEIMSSIQAIKGRKTSENCNHCNRTEVIDPSLAFKWHLDPRFNLLRFLQ